MTRRQEIIEILTEQNMSAQHLANYFRIEMKFILEDLEHIEKSIKPKKLKRKPAFCKSCEFVFKERSRVKKPTKCPSCRKEWIQESVFYIK